MNADENAADALTPEVSQQVDPTRARVVQEFQQTRAPGYCHFDNAGRLLFVGSEDNTIQQWNLATGECNALNGHSSWVRGFAVPRSGETFVSSGYDGDLIWWVRDSSLPHVANRIHAHKGWIRSCAISPDGRLLASGGNDRIVRLWSMSDRTLVAEAAGHQHDICSLAFHPEGNHLVSSDSHGVVKVWGDPNWQLTRELDASSTYFYSKSNRGVSGGLRSLAFSSDGRLLIGAGVVGGGDPLGQAVNPGAIVFDWTSGEKKTLLRARGNELGVAWGMICHPTDNFVAAVSGGLSAKHLYFWKTSDEQPFHVVDLPSPGRCIALHPDGWRLSVALHDGKIQIYLLG